MVTLQLETKQYNILLSANGSNVVDSHSISFDFGDAGSLTFAGHGGDGFMSANDDVMPTASEEPWDVISGADAGVINGFSGEQHVYIQSIAMSQV